MKIDSLEKLYQDQLAGLRYGDEMLLEFLSKILGAISHAELRDHVRELIPQIRRQAGRIEEILPRNPVTEQRETSPAMNGLLEEGHVFLERASEASVIDAGLLSLLQRIFHYSMSSYGAVRTYASMLGEEEHARALQRSLDEQKDADERLTQLALEAVNSDALNAGSRAA